MANPTTNFGWVMPTSTDLVTDLPADFAVFGQGVDTTLADLKGGTTGQVLAKNSNTDMDFIWSSVDPLTILDAKGDLISATAADSPARLAVGTNGQLLSADSSTSTGLKWVTYTSTALNQIATGTLSGASVAISSIPSTYKYLVISLTDVSLAANNVVTLKFNSTATGYNTFGVRNTSAAGSVLYSDTGGSTGRLNSNSLNGSSADGNFWVEIPNYAITGIWKTWKTLSTYQNNVTPAQEGFHGGGFNTSLTDAIDTITIGAGSSTFSAGTYTLYGVA